ncbi:MAG TPA: alpha/beta hydrolase [Nevskiaceae bacterium]|nr:alpha/beta hydrolase [Nevskiaceae bacterium]
MTLAALQPPAPGRSASGGFEGGAGAIEALLASPAGPARGIAVICHPHPLYGGAMSNKVVYSLAAVALQQGLHALRFNFRGVGRSAGVHDHAVGEADDTLLAVAWMRAHYPGLPLLLAGFSFGAYISLKVARQAGAQALASVAPPFGFYRDQDRDPEHPGCPWWVIHSRDDDTVSFEDTARHLAAYEPAPEQVTVDGAGHFFHGRLTELQDHLRPFVGRVFGAA